MKTKIIISTFLISFLFTQGFSQSGETAESLEKEIHTYIEIVEQKDFEAMLDYMPPKFLEKVPREAMIEGMQRAFNNPEIKMEMNEFKILKIHPLLELTEGKYTLVDYSFTLKMEMVIPEGEEAEDVKEQMAFTKSMLEMQHGKGAVKHDEEKNLFSIDVETTMYAISEAAYEGWKFIEKKDNMVGIMGQIMPQEAIDGLK